MCRRTKDACTLLGTDPSKWSMFEPVKAIPAVAAGFAPFERAVRLAEQGDLDAARASLLEIQGPAIQEWYIDHAQVAGSRRVRMLAGTARPRFEGEVDKRRHPSAEEERAVFTADGYRCRYCQRCVVTRRVLKLFHAVVGDGSFRMGSTNDSTHGAALAYRAVADHLIPRKRGGCTDPSNLVTACYPCNFGKADYCLKELRLEEPRPAVRDGWDGLESLAPALRSQVSKLARGAT